MNYLKTIILIVISLVIAYVIVAYRNETDITKPQINQQTQIVTPIPTAAQPTAEFENQQVTQPVATDSCREGNIIRQNVKPCSPDLECYSLIFYDERFCRLPDGKCKFFCTDK